MLFMHETSGELSHIALSPLLSIAMWFIISEDGKSNNVYLIAAVSFAVGLVTEEVIHEIVGFAQGRLNITDKSDVLSKK
jgi:hypothetical protein